MSAPVLAMPGYHWQNLPLKSSFSAWVRTCKIETFEIRLGYHDPQSVVEFPIAKSTWVKSQKVWRVFWQRADMKWHSYPSLPEVKSLQEFIDAVDADEYACFYG